MNEEKFKQLKSDIDKLNSYLGWLTVILLLIWFVCIVFLAGCDPKDFDNSDCLDAGTTRCNGTQIEIIDPYCEWEVFADCLEANMMCCNENGLPTCKEVCSD